MLIFKRLLLLSLCFTVFSSTLLAQFTGTIKVYGLENQYYPVVVPDSGWNHNVATILQLGRSWVHADSTWRGSMIAQFRYHTSNYGNASNFIFADVRENENYNSIFKNFIGGWTDVSANNSTLNIVIWLRGGGSLGMTYAFNCNYAITPTVYDGVQNALPYQIVNGGTVTSISTPYAYVNTLGVSDAYPAYASAFSVLPSNGNNMMIINNDLNGQYQLVNGGSAEPSGWAGKFNLNYVNYQGNHPRITVDSLGNVGIGIQNPFSLLTVDGTITAKQLVITTTNLPDYVFDSTYQRMSLKDVSAYVHTFKHLPNIPSAVQVDAKGMDLGEMQKLHLQKIEELTLYAIEADRKLANQQTLITEQQSQIQDQARTLKQLQQLLTQMQNQLQQQRQDIDALKKPKG